MGKGWSVIIVMITAAVAWLAVEKSAYTLAACAQIYEFILSLHQKISPCLPWLGLFCLFVVYFGLLWCVAYDSVFDARNNHMKKSFFCGILFSMALTTLAVISANFLDSERVLVVFGFLGIFAAFLLQFGACAIIAYTGDKPKKKRNQKERTSQWSH